VEKKGRSLSQEEYGTEKKQFTLDKSAAGRQSRYKGSKKNFFLGEGGRTFQPPLREGEGEGRKTGLGRKEAVCLFSPPWEVVVWF